MPSTPHARPDSPRNPAIPAWLLAAACLLALAGCAKPDERIPLTVWAAPSGVEEQGFRKLCDRFEREHPTIRVDLVGSLKEEKLIRAMVAGVPPDVAYLYGTSDVGPLAANGALTPLDDRFRASGFREEEFLPAAIAQGRFRGKLYAMPATRDCHGYYWSRAAFREAGLPQRAPATTEELFDWAVRLTKKGPDGRLTRIGFLPPDDSAGILSALGARWYDERTDRITLDAPENAAALGWLVKLVDAQGGRSAVQALKSSAGRTDSAQNPLATGKVAMDMNGEWIAMHLEKYAPQAEYGIGEVPHPAARPELADLAWQDGDVLLMPQGCHHPDAAWQLLAWMQQPRQQEEYAAAMNNLPSILSLMRSPALTEGAPRKRTLGYILQHIAGNAANSRFFPTLPVSRLYRDVLENAVEAAELHQKTPQQALTDAQRRLSTEYARYQAK